MAEFNRTRGFDQNQAVAIPLLTSFNCAAAGTGGQRFGFAHFGTIFGLLFAISGLLGRAKACPVAIPPRIRTGRASFQ